MLGLSEICSSTSVSVSDWLSTFTEPFAPDEDKVVCVWDSVKATAVSSTADCGACVLLAVWVVEEEGASAIVDAATEDEDPPVTCPLCAKPTISVTKDCRRLGASWASSCAMAMNCWIWPALRPSCWSADWSSFSSL